MCSIQLTMVEKGYREMNKVNTTPVFYYQVVIVIGFLASAEKKLTLSPGTLSTILDPNPTPLPENNILNSTPHKIPLLNYAQD